MDKKCTAKLGCTLHESKNKHSNFSSRYIRLGETFQDVGETEFDRYVRYRCSWRTTPQSSHVWVHPLDRSLGNLDASKPWKPLDKWQHFSIWPVSAIRKFANKRPQRRITWWPNILRRKKPLRLQVPATNPSFLKDFQAIASWCHSLFWQRMSHAQQAPGKLGKVGKFGIDLTPQPGASTETVTEKHVSQLMILSRLWSE